MKICVVGTGYVGLSLAVLLAQKYEVVALDISKDRINTINNKKSPIKDKKLEDYLTNKSLNLKSTINKDEAYSKAEYVIIATPTNYNLSTGSFDTSTVEEVISDSVNINPEGFIVIKSTIPLGFTDKMRNKFKKAEIIFSPEFLTERNSKFDIINQSRIILGGNMNLTQTVKKLYELRFKNKNIIETDTTTAELVKYMNNSFFATKVSIMNEFKLICDKIGANWEDALNGFASDDRVGNSHLNVPGHDGKLGYGGNCFPKDVNAFIYYAKKLDIDLNTITGGWKTNSKVRNH